MERRLVADAQHNPSTNDSAPLASDEDQGVVQALCRRDEQAFMVLVEQYQTPLLRLAMLFVSDRAAAEDVVQETWLGVLRGLHRFEGRSSLKTWIFRILMNTAKTRAIREGRSIPFSALEGPATDAEDPSVDPARFLPPDDPQWPGHWAMPPRPWNATPEALLLSGETRAHIETAIQDLKPAQREVITLRDIHGLSSSEVCQMLGITETNQRVLLHRARSKVRGALERYFEIGNVA